MFGSMLTERLTTNMKLTTKDFNQLVVNSMNWSEYKAEWQSQVNRFEDADFDSTEINYTFQRAYWLERYSDVLFAKVFLQGLEQDMQILFDGADDTYVIVTDFGGSL